MSGAPRSSKETASCRDSGTPPRKRRPLCCGEGRGCGAKLDLLALGGHLDRAGLAAELDPALGRLAAEAVEELVGVQRVVVEEQQPLGLYAAREGQRVGQQSWISRSAPRARS